MHLADLSTRLRRERIIFALNVALQDITQPASTADIVKMVAHRLEAEGPENARIIARELVRNVAPRIPQAQQGAAGFHRYGRDFHPWIWSPKRSLAKTGAVVQNAATTPEWDT